jgi:type IV pilus assembly protein PilX
MNTLNRCNKYRRRHTAEREPFQGRNQTGIVLFMSLVILLILTILGLSSVQTTSLQERMSRNASDSNLAFQAAESALRDGEDMLTGFGSLTAYDRDGGTGTGRERAPGEVPSWDLVDWSPSTDSCTGCIPAETVIGGTASKSKYIVEHVKTVLSDGDRLNLNNIGVTTGSGKTDVFRITAFGVGGTDTARVMLQSTYGVRY